ncbi:SIN1-domain-containing protein [Rickenella mellea]|uniref:SIN1-domain-containing protein n=1 Tax=Rickenella mellea TaxID=50990 RepID=A0A4Y7PW65_9AGAM|nr:SIN1-domain-containing protein [Rickenella mellea]
MSLISDPDYLIHNLRLTYFRHVDDPYAPRIISLNPRYASNPHVLAAGLADTDRWPELAVPSSPTPSDDEGTKSGSGRRRYSGFPGASLKHTQTIMGPSRVGAVGMRVSGKRASTLASKKDGPLPPLPPEANKRFRSDSAPTPVSVNAPNAPDSPTTSEDPNDGSVIHVGKRHSAGGTSLSEVPVTLIESSELENPSAKPAEFVPNFARAKEMEARRRERMRMRTRFPSTGQTVPRPNVAHISGNLNPEDSSPDEDTYEDDLVDSAVEDEDDFDDLAEVDESLGLGDDVDEFDPDFARPAIVASDSASDALMSGASGASNSMLSTSQSSPFAPSSSFRVAQSMRERSTLSPVSEGRVSEKNTAPSGSTAVNGTGPTQTISAQPSVDSSFELVLPPTMSRAPSNDQQPTRPTRTRAVPPPKILTNPPAGPLPDTPTFARRAVPPMRPSKSALTSMLASTSSTSSNPFSELYALISGRAEVASTTVTVFFPHASSPRGRPMNLNVRKDASVEEVIGFALWSYWEEGWLPKLDDGLLEEKDGEDDPKRMATLSAIGWVLRIAEDDGEVDEDFPAPDRMGKISKFNFDAYAILGANPSQLTQNKQLEAKIVRRPSRIIVAKKKPEPTISSASVSTGTITTAGGGGQPNGLLVPPSALGHGSSAISPSALGTSVGLGTSFGASVSHGPQILLRVRVADADDTAAHYSTTISVSSGMYMQETLEFVCRKRKIANPKEWALLLQEPKILIPLDRTVASLQGKSDLILVKRSSLPALGITMDNRAGRTTDPNASIFKRFSEVPEAKFSAEMDITAAYKRFTVFRKLPMLVARLERTLAIDGEYIHIMPVANRARVFDSVKTTSYRVKDITDCVQSAKNSSTFKMIVKRDGGDKRYDFEAESPKIASDIVTSIRSLKSSMDRTSTVAKLRRRSRHGG